MAKFGKDLLVQRAAPQDISTLTTRIAVYKLLKPIAVRYTEMNDLLQQWNRFITKDEQGNLLPQSGDQEMQSGTYSAPTGADGAAKRQETIEQQIVGSINKLLREKREQYKINGFIILNSLDKTQG
jgi:hypothetical protein